MFDRITAAAYKFVKGFVISAGEKTALRNSISAAATSTAINTSNSLQGGGSLASTRTLSLVGDNATPGNNKLYGTGNTGTKGWHDIPVISVAGKTGAVALEVADISGAVADSRTVGTEHSLQGGGALTGNLILSLVNDEAAPGNTKFYGTDESGVKGWYSIPAGGGGGPTFAGEAVTDVVAGSNITFSIVGGVATLNVSAGSATIGDGTYGDIVVTGTGTIWTIGNGAVTEAKCNASINSSLDLADSALQAAHNSAADAHGVRLPPTPVGQADGRQLVVAAEALVYADPPTDATAISVAHASGTLLLNQSNKSIGVGGRIIDVTSTDAINAEVVTADTNVGDQWFITQQGAGVITVLETGTSRVVAGKPKTAGQYESIHIRVIPGGAGTEGALVTGGVE